MISKIDFTKIFWAHVGTLRRFGHDKCSVGDLILFYLIPLLGASWASFYLKRDVGDGAISFLATIFSIFVGLLLNLLVLIIGVTPSDQKPDTTQDGRNITSSSQNRIVILKETFYNISYAILISVLLIILLFLSKLATGAVLTAISFTIYTIVGNFLLTLLMVLKRVHTLFDKS